MLLGLHSVALKVCGNFCSLTQCACLSFFLLFCPGHSGVASEPHVARGLPFEWTWSPPWPTKHRGTGCNNSVTKVKVLSLKSTAKTEQPISTQVDECQHKAASAPKISICSETSDICTTHLPLFNLPPAHSNTLLCVLSYYCWVHLLWRSNNAVVLKMWNGGQTDLASLCVTASESAGQLKCLQFPVSLCSLQRRLLFENIMLHVVWRVC